MPAARTSTSPPSPASSAPAGSTQSCTPAGTTQLCRSGSSSHRAQSWSTSTRARPSRFRRISFCRTWTSSRPSSRARGRSSRAALVAARPFDIPVVHTFHALGVVKKRYQGAKDTSPPERLAEERSILVAADHIVATCTDEVFELLRLGADPGRISVVPCGVDTELFRPDGPVEPGSIVPRIVVVTRLVERKGVADVIAALPRSEEHTSELQ